MTTKCGDFIWEQCDRTLLGPRDLTFHGRILTGMFFEISISYIFNENFPFFFLLPFRNDEVIPTPEEKDVLFTH